MATRSVFSAAVVCFALLGCESQQSRSDAQPSPRPQSQVSFRLFLFSFFFPPTQSKACDNAGNCDVSVFDQCIGIGNIFCRKWVDFEEIHLVKKDVKIIWHLQDGYRFCAALGDGVFLKATDDGQFDDMYPTSDKAGNNPAKKNKCKDNFPQHYHWRGLNTVQSSTPYEYMMIFHDSSGNRYVIDPWIYNE